MDWNEVLADPSLQDLPYKVETNEFGKIVMTPAPNRHVRMQFKIARLLDALISDGEVLGECSVETSEGVKVPDVAWLSGDFVARHGDTDLYVEAPELCVEVVSPSNSKQELDQKRRLFFERGAKEVWFCNSKGEVRFHAPEGEVEASRLFPTFPKKV